MRTRSQLTIVILLGLVCLNAAPEYCLFQIAVQQSLADTRISSIGLREPLLFSHLIIRGQVVEIMRDEIRAGDWIIGPSYLTERQIHVMNIGVAVTEVVKGQYTEEQCTLFAKYSPSTIGLLEKGKEYLFCAYYKEALREGSYVIGSGSDVFEASDGKWFRQYDRTDLTMDQIRARVSESDIGSVAGGADLIATGTIREKESTSSDEGRTNITKYTLLVDSTLKGQVGEEGLEFVTIGGGGYYPPWRTYTPIEINVGEQWYVFLKKVDIGYYPFAGVNGMFRIVGPKLMYDNSVEHVLDKEHLDEQVRIAVMDEN